MVTFNKTYHCVLLISAALLFNCNQTDNPVSGTQKIEYPQGGATASVFIKVTDVHSNAPVKGAVVSIEGSGSCSTSVSGVSRFDALRIGTYIVNAACAGYEPVASTVTIYADSVNSIIPVALQTTMDMQICRRGFVVRGEVYYQKDNKLYPVSQQLVELTLSTEMSSFLQPVRSVKTLPNGSYYFDNVPEYTEVTLQAKKYLFGGVNYSQSEIVSSPGGATGDTVNTVPVILKAENNGYFTILYDNSDSITGTTSYKITFSEPVDTSEFDPAVISVLEGGSKVLINTQWNKTLTILSIKPFGGNWSDGAMYYVYFGNIFSTSGKSFYDEEYSRSFAVLTNGVRPDVKNVNILQTIDYSTSNVQIKWSKLSGAGLYEIYCRIQGDSTWKSSASVSFSSDTFVQIYTAGIFSNGKSMDVMVLGVYKDGYRSDPATAQILTLKDRVRPLVKSSSAASVYPVYNCNNQVSSVVSLQFPNYVNFSEPLDTTKKPVITVKEASNSFYGDSTYALPADSIRCNWVSQSQLQLSATIPGLRNASYDSIFVDMKNVTDMSGNRVSFTDTLSLPVLKYVTR